jgi:hypothetical protein
VIRWRRPKILCYPTMSLPASFHRIAHAGSTVRGLFSTALFSTQSTGDKIVQIDGPASFEEVQVPPPLYKLKRTLNLRMCCDCAPWWSAVVY